MKLVDTHTHLYLPEFSEDIDAAIGNAKAAGVRQFYLPNIDSASIEPMLRLEDRFPGECFAMMGLHPCSVKENYREELAVVESWLKKRPFCAIGEIGIDLYWDKTFLEQQTDAFLTQVKWSVEMNLPIVIHSRESIDLLIDLLQKWEGKKPFGVFHCFGGSVEQAMAIMNLGFYLGIGGVVTYKKSGLQETLKHIPLDFIVLETDSPYLAPVPFRGKRNESSYIRLIAEQVALAKNIDLETVAVVTTANSEKIFEKKSPAYTTLS